MIASHLSGEQGHRLMLEQLGLSPVIHMKLRLGEGTGAAMTMHLVEASTKIMREMASFDEAGVTDLEEEKIMKAEDLPNSRSWLYMGDKKISQKRTSG